MKKLDRTVKKVLINYYMKTYGWSEKHTKEFIEATFDLWRETGILPDVMEAIKGVIRAIFEDIENNFEEYFEYNEFEDAVEIYPKTWQDFKKRWCGE